MKRFMEFVWPVIGLVALVASIWLLHRQLRGEAVGPEVLADLKSISAQRFALAIAATAVAYLALAWYDRIALLHLGVKHISWLFIGLCSFTTYAIAHNIGASVLSGAMVRYRAYSTKGLSAAQIGLLVGICSLTFALGALLVGGIVLICESDQMHRLAGFLPHVLTEPTTGRLVGGFCLALVAIYVAASILRLKPLVFGRLRLEYPRPGIVLQQLLASAGELLGAAGIIYFALPSQANPGFLVVLGVFIASFSVALASESPGGLGVFELLFLKAMPSVPHDKVLTALLVFRVFYLVLPLLFAAVVVALFERRRLAQALTPAAAGGRGSTADKPRNAAGIAKLPPSPADP